MKEFMLLIRTDGDHLAGLTPEGQQAHIRKIGAYIGNLVSEGKLKDAQPLETGGTTIYGNKGVFKDGPFAETKEVIVGYFLVRAKDLDEAIAIGKANPVFDVAETWMEVRPVKTMEGIN